MSVPDQDKPVEMLREEVIDQLIMNYGHGELSLDAFDRRLGVAIDSSDHTELAGLIADLSLAVDKTYADKKKQELGIRYETSDAEDIDYMINIFGGSNRSVTTPSRMIAMKIDITTRPTNRRRSEKWSLIGDNSFI